MAIRQRSRMAERINKLRGISPIEKDLLRRIGEVVDGGINNRGPTNPGVQGRRRQVRSPILPPPRGIKVTTSSRLAKIEWQPVNSPILLLYEVQIIDKKNNFSQLKLAFTNSLFFGERGSFLVKVRSVGRNGDVSPFSFEEAVFTLTDDALFLEGNKVTSIFTAEEISEDIFAPADYTIFSWGAFNLSNFVSLNQAFVPSATLTVNDSASFYSKLAFFRETEAFSNVDDSSLSGEVRPTSEDRGSFFATPFSAMFKPLEIKASDPFSSTLINTAPVFKLSINNDQKDSAASSLTLLSIPAANAVIEEEPFDSFSSIEIPNASFTPINFKSPSFRGATLGTGPRFTIGMWIKFSGEGFNLPPTMTFDIRGLSALARVLPVSPLTRGKREDVRYSIGLGPTFGGGQASFFKGGENGERAQLTMDAPALGAFLNSDSSVANYNLQDKASIVEMDSIKDASAGIFAQGNLLGDNLLVNSLGKWIFVAATYDSTKQDDFNWISYSGFGTFAILGKARKHNLYLHGRKLQRRVVTSTGFGVDLVPGNMSLLPFPGISNLILLDPRLSSFRLFGYSFPKSGGILPMRLHSLAIWDGVLEGKGTTGLIVLEQAELFVLANNPMHDLRVNLEEYTSASRLAHWWVFGRNPNPTTKSEIAEDLGFSVPIDITNNSSLTFTQALDLLVKDRPDKPSGQGSGVGIDS